MEMSLGRARDMEEWTVSYVRRVVEGTVRIVSSS